MSVTQQCILGALLVSWSACGCANVGAKKSLLNDLGDSPPAVDDRSGAAEIGTAQTRVQSSTGPATTRAAQREPPAAAAEQRSPQPAAPRTNPIAELELALNSPQSSLTPEHKAYLREQLQAVLAEPSAQPAFVPTAIESHSRPADAAATVLPGPQSPPVSTAIASNVLSVTQRLTDRSVTTVADAQKPAPLRQNTPPAETSVSVPPTSATKTSINDESSRPWRDQLDQTIKSLEREIKDGDSSGPDAELLAASARLLHLVANHREEAVAEIDQMDENEREYWKHQIHALLVALDAEDKHAGGRWAALILREMRAASDHLSNISALDVRNLAFCSRVDGFGNYTRFNTTTFKPGQNVLLYVEIDNFSTEQISERFATELQPEYSIVNSDGQRISNKLPVMKDESRNRRHDYFASIPLELPRDLTPGKYTLQLVVEDVKGKKSSQATIEFSIR